MLNSSYACLRHKHALPSEGDQSVGFLFGCYATSQQTVNKQTNKQAKSCHPNAFVLFMKGVMMREGYKWL